MHSYCGKARAIGPAGALYFVGNVRIRPDAAFGAVVSWLLNKFFANYCTWYQLCLGVLAIAVTLLFRRGLWG